MQEVNKHTYILRHTRLYLGMGKKIQLKQMGIEIFFGVFLWELPKGKFKSTIKEKMVAAISSSLVG